MLWLSLVLKLGNFHLVYFLLKGHQFFVNRVKSKIKIKISNKTKIIPSGDVYQNIDIAVKMAAKYIKIQKSDIPRDKVSPKNKMPNTLYL